MALKPSSRLGPYEVIAPLGAGGMGEVYKARDTRLDRTVAIKVLPPDVASSPERRARFEREAKAASALNDPHICTVHDIGREGEVDYLVMEFLEGETLAQRLGRGSLPLEEVLRYGSEIARALEKAHRAGIVHRDVKPGNVMLTKGGVKLLDFGLAKHHRLERLPLGDSDSPTKDGERPLTGEGKILGTFQYLSPEQLEGKEVDGRTDVWGLGAVLYEMATGKRAFSGSSPASVIAAILSTEPPSVTREQPLAPALFDAVVRRCLAKDPDDRWQSASDVAVGLELVRQSAPKETASTPSRLGYLIAAVALGIAGFVALRNWDRAPQDEPIVTSISPPPGAQTAFTHGIALSPDGQSLAFEAIVDGKSLLWVYSLANGQYRSVPGTEGATYPFWSPDGHTVGFFSRGQVKKVPVSGGPPQTVSRVGAGYPFGGSWGKDGTIYFHTQRSRVIQEVSSSGGAPRDVTQLDVSHEDTRHRVPHMLPDGEHLLYTALGGEPGIYIGSRHGGSGTFLTSAVWAFEAEGHLIYTTREGALLAQRLDVSQAQLLGEAFPLTPDRLASGSTLASASPARLVFKKDDDGGPPVRLVWMSREGKELSTLTELVSVWAVRISPDGKQVAFTVTLDASSPVNVWLVDASGSGPRRLGEGDARPVWSPDGKSLAHRKSIGGRRRAVIQSLATGSEELLLNEPESMSDAPEDWSSDGGNILIHQLRIGTTNSHDIWSINLSTREASAVVEGEADEFHAVLSPDGQSIAYTSDEAGQPDVYLRRFDGKSAPRRVSADGGMYPLWRRDGRELYFVAPGGKVMSVPVLSLEPLETGAGRLLFAVDSTELLDDRLMSLSAPIDVTADGERFLVAVVQGGLTPLTLIQNWQALLKAEK